MRKHLEDSLNWPCSNSCVCVCVCVCVYHRKVWQRDYFWVCVEDQLCREVFRFRKMK